MKTAIPARESHPAMFWFFYNVAFSAGFILMVPRFLARMWRRGGYRRGFMQRLGRYDGATLARLGRRPRIWIHAVSVGEVLVALGFMRAFRARHPEAAFVLTTTTSTGRRVAAARLSDVDALLYFPVDVPPAVRRALRALRPRALLLVECELWPNLIRLAADQGIPVVLINGRISASSYRGYRRLKAVSRRILPRFDLLLVQSRRDAERLEDLGAAAERLRVLGTAKYDVAQAGTDSAGTARRVLEQAGMRPGDPVLAGGSTWPGEERVLLQVVQRLRGRFPSLRLVLVPRHAERAARVEAEIEGSGLRGVRRSRMEAGSDRGEADVLLVDTTGELSGFYACASVIFVGKSLTCRGGQNLIEPAMCGKPSVFGPHTENFSTVADDLLAAKAAVRVADAAQLEEAVRSLLESDAERDAMGRRARAVVENKRGTLEKSVALISALLEARGR